MLAFISQVLLTNCQPNVKIVEDTSLSVSHPASVDFTPYGIMFQMDLGPDSNSVHITVK